MNKTAKIVLTGFSFVLLGLILVIYVLPELVSPNHYKTELSALIKRKTGLDAAFKGKLAVSVFPELSLNVEKMEISNKLGSQEIPLLTVENSAITLKLFPLLRNKVAIQSIALDGLNINLVKDEQGTNNWDGLIAPSPAFPPNTATTKQDDAKSPGQFALAALAVNGIDIRNARVNWHNQETGARLEIKDIRLNADKFMFGEWVNIKVAMAVSTNNEKFPLPVNWALKCVTDFRFDEKRNHFDFRHSRLEGVTSEQSANSQPLAFDLTIPKAEVNLDRQTLRLTGLQFHSGDIKATAELTGEQMTAKAFVQGSVTIAPFNPRNSLKQWADALPATQDATALTRLGMAFQFTATPDQAQFNNVDMLLDDSHGTGSLTIKDFARPTLLVDLAADSIDVDRYLTPQDKSTRTNLLSAGTYIVPLDWFRELNVEGNIRLGKMTFNKMTLQNARLTLASKKGAVIIRQKTRMNKLDR